MKTRKSLANDFSSLLEIDKIVNKWYCQDTFIRYWTKSIMLIYIERENKFHGTII